MMVPERHSAVRAGPRPSLYKPYLLRRRGNSTLSPQALRVDRGSICGTLSYKGLSWTSLPTSLSRSPVSPLLFYRLGYLYPFIPGDQQPSYL